MAKREKDWTILSMLEWATDYFEKNNVANPRLSIEWLLADLLGLRRLDLYLNFDRPLSPNELEKLRPIIKRRSLHEPLQYITGSTDFMGCTIELTPSVLIPRTETEQLVEIILDDYRTLTNETLHMLDIGTGSGCISIAIAKAHPNWECTGVDISERALDLAERNSSINGVEIELLKADFLSLSKCTHLQNRTFDMVVSNPPYILPEERKYMDKQILEYEPEEALFHENPVKLYHEISKYAFTNTMENGKLYLECNQNLTGQIKEVLTQTFPIVDILLDYDKKERFIRAAKSS